MWCGRTVLMKYGVLKTFLSCILHGIFLSQIVWHKGSSPLPNRVPTPLPKVSSEPIPVACIEHVQLFRVKETCQKESHMEPMQINKKSASSRIKRLPNRTEN